MTSSSDDIRDEVLAMLAAHRELPPEADEELARAFLERVRQHSSSPAAIPELMSVLREHMPLSFGQLAAVVVGQGVVVALVGMGIISFFGISTDSDHWIYDAAPVWDTLALVWFLEVIATIVAVIHLRPRGEDKSAPPETRHLPMPH